MRVRSHTGWLTRWLGAGAVVAALSAVASAAWDGTQEIVLGDQVSASFVAEPGLEVHRLEFFAPAGTVLSVKVKTVEGDLTPTLSLLDHEEADVPLGGALSAGGIAAFPIDEGGWYTLRVTAASGSGRYVARTKGKFPRKAAASVPGDSFAFEAVAGSLLSASVKPAPGSAARPVITSLDAPEGLVAVNEGTRISRVGLPSSGEYELGWRDDGEGGDTAVLVKVAPPRAKRLWFFDIVEDPDGIPVEIRSDWLGSPHADRTAHAFHNWDAAGAIPTSCAKCHSSAGFRDFIGADGSTPGVVDAAAPTGTVIDCNACHNATAIDLSTVTFPSGLVVEGLGAEARCMQCHQGRESSLDVDADIAASGAGDDEVKSTLRFLNIHYLSAAATLYGNQAQGAYQFAGKVYNNRFRHVAAYDTCVECHDAHTLQPRLSECRSCHPSVNQVSDLRNLRMERTNYDYDGDGNTTEGVHGELEGLAAALLGAIRQYAKDVAGQPIAYSPDAYPYFFKDLNDNGVADASEATNSNRFASFTPRLLRAAYNYQYSRKDPGAYAHNARYMMEILHDAIAHLDEHPSVTVPNFENLVRNEADGHFDATAEAYRHWDADGAVQASCARCHSPAGFEFRQTYGLDITVDTPLSDGMTCETCHVGGDFGSGNPALKYVASVTFPSGVTIDNNPADPDASFLCMTCHQGRESAASVDAAIVAGTPSFKNIHYLAAGPTLYGADAHVGYQYEGKTYVGKWRHFAAGPTNECTFCHLADHTFKPRLTDLCNFCHDAAQGDIEKARLNRETDFDGDGNNTETLREEVKSFGDRLYASIRAYATNNRALNIAYDGDAYPYWFKDPNNNGVVDPGEGGNSNRYNKWDAALMKATFNFQMWKKEPGAWAHNTHYILQLLYDSTQDLGGSLTGLTRPGAYQ